MGNWRRVQIKGSVSVEDQPALAHWINIGDEYDRFHCLCQPGPGGICGLGPWGDVAEINALGNLAERDFTITDVVEAFEEAVNVAPSLDVLCHVGNDHEANDCVGTVAVKGGRVVKVGAMVEEIPEIDTASLRGRMFDTLVNAQRARS